MWRGVPIAVKPINCQYLGWGDNSKPYVKWFPLIKFALSEIPAHYYKVQKSLQNEYKRSTLFELCYSERYNAALAMNKSPIQTLQSRFLSFPITV